VTEFFEYADVEQFMDVDDFFITAYEKIVFPVWYDYWSAMGIDETRDTIEEIYDQIVNITKYPLQKQFVVLNTAKNASHQNGSMLEYYEEKWGMDYVLFEKLTEIDTSEWDEELEEIGVVL
jgi:cellulose biosynthesis protein BcsQ